MYIHITCMYIYIYIYRERERDRERYICIYVYVYICIYIVVIELKEHRLKLVNVCVKRSINKYPGAGEHNNTILKTS